MRRRVFNSVRSSHMMSNADCEHMIRWCAPRCDGASMREPMREKT
jgi:hypothetical protein